MLLAYSKSLAMIFAAESTCTEPAELNIGTAIVIAIPSITTTMIISISVNALRSPIPMPVMLLCILSILSLPLLIRPSDPTALCTPCKPTRMFSDQTSLLQPPALFRRALYPSINNCKHYPSTPTSHNHYSYPSTFYTFHALTPFALFAFRTSSSVASCLLPNTCDL